MFFRSGEVIRRLREQVSVLMDEVHVLKADLKQAEKDRRSACFQATEWKDIAERRAAALAAVRNALEETV